MRLTTTLTSFRILITGSQSGLVETITDAVSIHSIKKAEYAKRLASGKLGHVTLMDHFTSVRLDLALPRINQLNICVVFRHTATHLRPSL